MDYSTTEVNDKNNIELNKRRQQQELARKKIKEGAKRETDDLMVNRVNNKAHSGIQLSDGSIQLHLMLYNKRQTTKVYDQVKWQQLKLAGLEFAIHKYFLTGKLCSKKQKKL